METSTSLDFSCFCTYGFGFGRFEVKGDADLSFGTVNHTVLYGTMNICNFVLESSAHVMEASLDGSVIDASMDV
jgi:hypothetical protein